MMTTTGKEIDWRPTVRRLMAERDAARLAGKIEGLEEIFDAISDWNDDTLLSSVLDLIRARLTELQATTKEV